MKHHQRLKPRDYTATTTAHTVLSSILLCRGRSATSCAPQSSSSSRSNILPGALKCQYRFPIVMPIWHFKNFQPKRRTLTTNLLFLAALNTLDCPDRSHSLKLPLIFTANCEQLIRIDRKPWDRFGLVWKHRGMLPVQDNGLFELPHNVSIIQIIPGFYHFVSSAQCLEKLLMCIPIFLCKIWYNCC